VGLLHAETPPLALMIILPAQFLTDRNNSLSNSNLYENVGHCEFSSSGNEVFPFATDSRYSYTPRMAI
jgi:hypothetical protein